MTSAFILGHLIPINSFYVCCTAVVAGRHNIRERESSTQREVSIGKEIFSLCRYGSAAVCLDRLRPCTTNNNGAPVWSTRLFDLSPRCQNSEIESVGLSVRTSKIGNRKHPASCVCGSQSFDIVFGDRRLRWHPPCTCG